VSERSIGHTDQLTQTERAVRPAPHLQPRSAPDGLGGLAADLDLATRVSVRLRPDGLIEVTVGGSVVGFIDHVTPVYVVLSGSRLATAVEIAQRRTLPHAVDALRFAWEDGR
jgi:hypothetical protein